MNKQGAGIEAISFFFRDSHSFTSRTCDFLCEASINDFNAKPQLVVRHTGMKYDERLVKSFLKANEKEMIQSYIDEVITLSESGKSNYISEADFAKSIQSELGESRLGLCIIANTQPVIKRLIKIDVIKQALKNKELSFFDKRAYSADNCIACKGAAGHDRIYKAAAFKTPAFFDEMLKEDYKEHAQNYFLKREELLDLYRKIILFAAKKPRSADEISRYHSISSEKTAFAVKVFTELLLIETDISGRIHALKTSDQKRELRQSICYKSFEDFVNER